MRKKGVRMSAFLVEDKTINKIVTKLALDRDGEWLRRRLAEKGYDLNEDEGRRKLGWDMFGLNIRAVNQRYGERGAAGFRPLNYKYSLEANYSKVSALKSLQCWAYQCTEGDCDKSDLFVLMEFIKSEWAQEIVRSLPEYEKVMWG